MTDARATKGTDVDGGSADSVPEDLVDLSVDNLMPARVRPSPSRTTAFGVPVARIAHRLR